MEWYGHDPVRWSKVPIPKGQATLRRVGLAAVGRATHGDEVLPVQQDVVKCTRHSPRDQIAGEGKQSAIASPWFCDESGAGDGCGVIYYFILT